MHYFRVKGRLLLLIGAAIAGATVLLGLTIGRGWMMGVMAPLPLMGFGAAMLLAPGSVKQEAGTTWEAAWVATPGRLRAIWLFGLLVGCAGGMLVWMLLIPFISLGAQ